MIIIETKTGSSVEKFIELLKQKEIGWIFTSRDMGMTATDAGNCIDRLLPMGAFEFIGRMKTSPSHSLKQYRYVKELGIKAKAGERDMRFKPKAKPFITGVFADLYIMPAPIVLGRGCTVHAMKS